MNYDSKILDGRAISENILRRLRSEINLQELKLGLAVILVGDDPSSHLYVRLKKKACERVGIDFHRYLFEGDYTTEEIIETIKFLNGDPETTGILVQLPLPAKYDTDRIISAIDPAKDVDGFHPVNLAKIKNGEPAVASPMVEGIMELIRRTGEEMKDKHITILCNHKIFGEPFTYFFDPSNTINIVTTEDADYKEKVKIADVLIVGVGLPLFITPDMVKDGVIIIDNGINKVPESNMILGDADFFNLLPKVKFISPVPGGVGPMTVAMLLTNLRKLPKLQS